MTSWAMVSSRGGGKCVASGWIVQVGQVTYGGRPDRVFERKTAVKNDSKIFGLGIVTVAFC